MRRGHKLLAFVLLSCAVVVAVDIFLALFFPNIDNQIKEIASFVLCILLLCIINIKSIKQ